MRWLVILALVAMAGCALEVDETPSQRARVIVTPDGFRVRHGPCTTWYDGGQRRAEGCYWQGRRVGHWRFWYPDGTPQARGDFHLGTRTGYWVTWQRDGTVAEAGLYVEDRKVGRW